MKKKLNLFALSLSICAVVAVLTATNTKAAVFKTSDFEGSPAPMSIISAEQTVAVIETPGPHGIIAYKA